MRDKTVCMRLSDTYYIGKSCFLLLNGTFVEDIYESIHRNRILETNFIKIVRKEISVTNRFSDLIKKFFFSLSKIAQGYFYRLSFIGSID